MPLEKPLAAITEADLLNLKANAEAEQQVIDYKKELNFKGPGDPKKDPKDEFRADVTSFANASGGHLVIGMDEKQGFPTDLCGMAVADPDAFKRQIDDVLQTKITPRVPGVTIQPIPLSTGRLAFVIRIPRSFAKPHQITVGKDDFQFWARNSAGKYRLDVGELRSIFLRSETLVDSVRRFRQERLANLLAGDTPVPLLPGARMILHLIPLSAFDPASQINFSVLEQAESRLTAPLYPPGTHSSIQRHFNLEGMLTVRIQSFKNETMSYQQVFRNGIIESVDTFAINRDSELPYFTALHEKMLLDAVKQGGELLEVLGVPPPVSVIVTLTGVAAHRIEVGPNSFRGTNDPFGRDILILPDVVSEHLQTDSATVMRPILDAIWNAGGFVRCTRYNEAGEWSTGQR